MNAFTRLKKVKTVLPLIASLFLGIVACSGDDAIPSSAVDGISTDSSFPNTEIFSSSDDVLDCGTGFCINHDAKSSSSTLAPDGNKQSSSVRADFMTDSRDMQTYRIVTIGSQIWMAENLNFSTNSSFCYENKPSLCDKYGRLYTWAAAMDSAGVYSTNGKGCGHRSRSCAPIYPVRGICPSGWHLPSREDFDILFNAVGGMDSAAKVLKSPSTPWKSLDPNGFESVATDDFGFSVLSAGYAFKPYYESYNAWTLVRDSTFINTVEFTGIGEEADFWSSTPCNVDEYSCVVNSNQSFFGNIMYDAYVISLENDLEFMIFGYEEGFRGHSIRCLKDSAPSPGIVASSSSKTTPSSSSYNGWSWDVPREARLNPEITYGEMVDNRDGKIYKTVVIGNQTWMAQNLNYDPGFSVCYDDNPDNCDVAGRLYTWTVAIDTAKLDSASIFCDYYRTCTLPDTVYGVCPPGWHLPNIDEWMTLITAVGGEEQAGKVLKSQSGWGWYSNGNGTDSFGFSALPAGLRKINSGQTYEWGGYFDDVGDYAGFWSAAEKSKTHGRAIVLKYNLDAAGVEAYVDKHWAISVRCVENSN